MPGLLGRRTPGIAAEVARKFRGPDGPCADMRKEKVGRLSSMAASWQRGYPVGVAENPPASDALRLVGDELKMRDRERWLSCLWAPADARPALFAVHALDAELARVVSEMREPLLAEIRLAWWREQLQSVARGGEPPAQPLLQLLAREARPRVDLDRLSQLEDAFLPLVSEGPFDASEHCRLRGRTLFEALFSACAREDASGRAAARAAGELWAGAALWRQRWGASLPEAAAGTNGRGEAHLSRDQLRALPTPLRTLTLLAIHDLETCAAGHAPPPRATAGRQLRMARAALLAR
jgi:phytoene synthase